MVVITQWFYLRLTSRLSLILLQSSSHHGQMIPSSVSSFLRGRPFILSLPSWLFSWPIASFSVEVEAPSVSLSNKPYSHTFLVPGLVCKIFSMLDMVFSILHIMGRNT